MKNLIHYLAAIVILVSILALVTGPASVTADNGEFEVIASGLDNPRGLTWNGGELYVAEAGIGGDDPCVVIRGDSFCFGLTGAITRIKKGHKERIITGLPSLALEDSGNEATGPHDVSLRGKLWFVTGLGGDPAFREGLLEGADDLGMLFEMQRRGKGTFQLSADLAAYEEDVNPHDVEVDSNPYSVLALKGNQGAIVVDAGGNTLLKVDHDGDISGMKVFPDRPNPLGFGPPTFQSVPTSVVQGPDGALYVGELTGFPFPPGEAKVYRIDHDGDPFADPEVFESGFTNVIDIAFDHQGRLLVLEISKNGLGPGSPDPTTGALIRVNHDGTRDELASDGLFMPTGLAVGPKGGIYISNCGVCAGIGEVIRINPD
jgi:hypothetical protein